MRPPPRLPCGQQGGEGPLAKQTGKMGQFDVQQGREKWTLFEKSCKKLLVRAINNIHNIYLVKYLDSLKDKGTCAEVYKIKGLFDY